jgi:hypothetical protein
MTLSHLTQSANVIDLRTMLHLMPAQFAQEIFETKLVAMTLGFAVGLSIALVIHVFIQHWKGLPK